MPDGQRARFAVLHRDGPKLGDQSSAATVRVDAHGRPPAFIDLIAVRLGDAIVFTNGERYEGTDLPASLTTAQLDELTRRAVSKAQDAL